MKNKKYRIDWESFGYSHILLTIIVAGISCIGGMFIGAEIVYNTFMA